MILGNTNLPNETIIRIFSFFKPTDLAKAASVSKDFNKFSKDNSLWKEHLKQYGIPSTFIDQLGGKNGLFKQLYVNLHVNLKKIIQVWPFLNLFDTEQPTFSKQDTFSIICLTGDLSLIEKFIKENPNRLKDVPNALIKLNALHYAALLGDNQVIQLLLNTTNFNLLDKVTNGSILDDDAIEVALGFGREDDDDDERKLNLLHFAAASGNADLVLFLIATGKFNREYIFAQDREKNNMLHFAAASGSVDLIKYLLSQLRFDARAVNELGYNFLQIAVQAGRIELVKIFTSNNRNLNLIHPDTGYNLLHIAAEYEHKDIVEYLIGTRQFKLDALTREGDNIANLVEQSKDSELIAYVKKLVEPASDSETFGYYDWR